MNLRVSSIHQILVAVAILFISFIVGFALPARAATGDLIITGVIDGPLTGGIPKAIEVYVVNDIADLSIYGLGSANNGGGTDGEEFTFPADSATAGDFIYIATEATGFTSFFGFAPDYTDSSAPNINGDDAIELFQNGSVVDVFGDINVDGTGQAWDHEDGWAYRVDETGQDSTTFVLANWTFSGRNALDEETSNDTAATPFPIGTYSPGSVSDSAPSVSSTTPTNGTGGVAVDANIAINFSEGVTTSGSWFGISCDTSGAHTAVASGGPQNYTLNPDTDFANEETCTVTVYATQITDTDTDDPPDNMAADNVFSFDTVPTTPADLVINEVDADQASDDTAEFIELYDGGSGNTSLDGLVLVLFNGNGDVSYQAFDLDGRSTDANGLYVICGNEGNVANCDWDVTPDQDLVQNGADAVALYLGDSADFPNGTAVTTSNLVDALVYDTSDADDAGLLVLLNSGEPQVNEGGGGDSTIHSNQRCPNGAGGQRNTSFYQQLTPSPGVANDCSSTDLELLIRVSDTNPDESDTITYTVMIDNSAASTDAATGVVVQIYLPDTGTQISYTSNDCGASLVGNTLTRNLGNLAIGASSSCVITVDIRTGTDGTTFATSAEVFAADQNDPDSTPGNLATVPAEDDEVRVAVQVGAPAACGTSATAIHDIQGTGDISPMDGTPDVTIEGIVVGDFQSTDELQGFYVQEEDSDADTDAASSEGIFVYDDGYGIAVNVGDVVRVQGDVTEYSGLTELNNVDSVLLCPDNGGSVSATSVSLPLASSTYLERHEGMLANLVQTLYVTEHYNLGRYGNVLLSSGGRLPNPTHITTPGALAIAQQAANNLNRILIDDGSTVQNPDPIAYPSPELSATNTLRGAYTVTGLEGVVTYAFGDYVVHPTAAPSFVAANPRPAAPPVVHGSLRVASFNVLNYFNGDGLGGGFPTARGASTLEEFNRQRDKIIAAIVALDADIIGLMEIENDGYGANSAIQDLVNGLNAAAPISTTYAFVDPGVSVIGTDAIAVGLIYISETVSTVGSPAILDSSVDPQFLDTKNRPTLLQTFQQDATGETFSVAVNHLKSKGSACDDVGDPDTGDGQGNCNLTRTDAAEALRDWLATDPTGSGDADFLIIGDMNAYANEDPITTLEAAGYSDLLESYNGTGAYSYVFDGQWGYLDHALANASLSAEIVGANEWHINADEPRSLDYNVEYKTIEQVSSLYSADAYRASDHDPVLVGIFPYDFSDLASSYGVAWHTGNGTLHLGSEWDDEPDYGDAADDGTDDGVERVFTRWVAGETITIVVTTNGAGYLAGWFDWDGSGVFDGSERTVAETISAAGTHTVTFTVDAGFRPDLRPSLQARFRLYSSEPTTRGTETATGAGDGGKVEDYTWGFTPTAVTVSAFGVGSSANGGFLLSLLLVSAMLAGMGVRGSGRQKKK